MVHHIQKLQQKMSLYAKYALIIQVYKKQLAFF